MRAFWDGENGEMCLVEKEGQYRGVTQHLHCLSWIVWVSILRYSFSCVYLSGYILLDPCCLRHVSALHDGMQTGVCPARLGSLTGGHPIQAERFATRRPT